MLSSFPTISKKYANQDDYAITNQFIVSSAPKRKGWKETS
jgi:hypothetical protein